MADLTLGDFAPSLGETWDMEAGGQTLPVELIDASALRESGRPGGSFRLEFRGPPEFVAEQGMHIFRRGGVEHEIFVCPIARDEAGTRYEAIFY